MRGFGGHIGATAAPVSLRQGAARLVLVGFSSSLKKEKERNASRTCRGQRLAIVGQGHRH